jgi:hypothetical protein
VELGVREGVSSFVFEKVARICDACLVSVDLEETIFKTDYPKYYFLQKDDIVFAEEFKEWTSLNQVPSKIDILFIDTSHYYEHTKKEIESWFKYLAEDATVIFHDTNLTKLNIRKDGVLCLGWDNERGVICALEDYFSTSFYEKEDFSDLINDWLIIHSAASSGLTILKKINSK